MRKITLIIFCALFISVAKAREIESANISSDMSVTIQCMDGHKFAVSFMDEVFSTQGGAVSIVQVYEYDKQEEKVIPAKC